MASKNASKSKKNTVHKKQPVGSKATVTMQLTTVLPRKYSAAKRKKMKELERQYLSGILK